jgi:trk system potassium uptake protein TrkA
VYILIVNADPLGRSLAAALVRHGHEVAYLDEDPEYCNRVATELGCLVIQGETTDIGFLQEAGIERADVVVALLDKDIKNIMVGLFARQFGVPRIMALLGQQHYRAAYELAGIQSVFNAFEFLQNKMLIAIEDPRVKQVMALGSGRIEIASLEMSVDSPLIGRPLPALWEHPHFPDRALVLGILKSDDQTFHLPREKPVVEQDDDVLLLGSPDDVHRIAQILDRRRGWSA